MQAYTRPADVSRETEAKLIELEKLLIQWNGSINLTGAKSREELRDKQTSGALFLADCLKGELKKKAVSVYDLGSGNGMPALALAAVFPATKITMIESDTRKCAFLREAVFRLKLNAEIWHKRAEACRIPAPAIITACAFKRTKDILALTCLIAPEAALYLLKGGQAAQESEEARELFHFDSRFFQGSEDGGVLAITNVRKKA